MPIHKNPGIKMTAPRLFVLALSLSAAVLAPAQAQNAPQNAPQVPTVTDTKTSGSWTVRCYHGGNFPCDMTQITVDQSRRVPVASVLIAYAPKTNTYFGRFGVPLGVSFESGLGIEIGSFKASNLKFRICEREGCFVSGSLPQNLIDAMQAPGAPQGAMSGVMVDGQKFQIPIVLDGFSDGLDLLKKWTTAKAGDSDKTPKK